MSPPTLSPIGPKKKFSQFLGSNFGVYPKKSPKSPFGPQREFRHVWGVKIGVLTRAKSIFDVFRPTRGPLGPQNSKNTQKRAIFGSILALARQDPERFRVFFAYSCSHRAYGSNGVSHTPNLAWRAELWAPKVGSTWILDQKDPKNQFSGPKWHFFLELTPAISRSP